MKEFRLTRKMQIFSALRLLLLIIFTGLLIYALIKLGISFNGMSSEGSSLSWWKIFGGKVLLFGMPIVLLTIWAFISVVATFKVKLIFEEQQLTFQSLDHLTFLLPRALKPFSVRYDQVGNVSIQSMNGLVEIRDVKGGKHFLFPAWFGDHYGKDIFVELQNRLSPKVFTPGIYDVLKKWSIGNKVRSIFLVFFWSIYLLAYVLDPLFSPRTWFINAWHVEYRPFGYESVWTYSVNSHDDLWIAAWQPTYYRVYKFSNHKENEWKLPNNLLDDQYPQLVSEDNAGLPIVWLGDKVLHYDNGTWKPIPYDRNLQLGDWDWRGVVSARQAWVIDDEKPARHLLKIDALTGDWIILPLPVTAKEQNLSPELMERAVNGDLLVLTRNEVNTTVYLLSNDDKWREQGYPVILPPDSHIQDYFLDVHDSLWVLVETQHKTIVEKINPDGTLQLTQLPPIKDEDRPTGYRSIIVDSLGRLWVGGYPDSMAVFTPLWSGDATEVIRYTENNSNFQRDVLINPVLLPDGKIWSLDRWISTMDTNSEALPEPLPDWFASRDWALDRLFLFLGMVIIFVIMQLFFLRWDKR